MDMNVVYYQIMIGAGIPCAAILLGMRGLVVATMVALLWTLVLVYQDWLMVLQVITVGLAFVWGSALVNSRIVTRWRKQAWVAVVAVATSVMLLNSMATAEPQVTTSRVQSPALTAKAATKAKHIAESGVRMARAKVATAPLLVANGRN